MKKKKKWREVLSWMPDNKPNSTRAVVVVNKKGKVKRLPYTLWNEANQSYSHRVEYTYVTSTNRGKQRFENNVAKSKGKYMHVTIKSKAYSVHRLVALAWVDNPDNKPQVNHIDGNRSNNHYKNLEWVTNKENRQHAHDTGLLDHLKGIFNTVSTENVEMITKMIKEGMSSFRISEAFNGEVSHETIRLFKNKEYPHIQTIRKKHHRKSPEYY